MLFLVLGFKFMLWRSAFRAHMPYKDLRFKLVISGILREKDKYK